MKKLSKIVLAIVIAQLYSFDLCTELLPDRFFLLCVCAAATAGTGK